MGWGKFLFPWPGNWEYSRRETCLTILYKSFTFMDPSLFFVLFGRHHMKTFSLMFRRLVRRHILSAIILSSPLLYAQPGPINGNLTGAGTIGTVNVETSGGTQFNAAATPEGIYIKNSQTADIDYIKIYSPPSGKSIQRIEVKIDAVGPFNIPRNRQQALVLLNDGTVLVFDFSNYSTSKGAAIKNLGKPSSADLASTWDRVLGDAVYLLGASVYVSRDTGATWQIDTAGFGNGVFARNLALDSSEYVYAATTAGLFMQSPDTSIWHQVTTLTTPTALQTVYIDRLNRIFVVGSGNSGVFSSTDGGLTWNPDTAGIGLLALSNFGDDQFHNIYATSGNGTLYKSAGGTGAWVRVDAGILATTVNPPVINAITGDSTVIAATSFGIFVTPDQGNTWYESNGGIRAENFYGFAKHSPNRILVSTDLGIYYNDAGDTAWHKSFPPAGYLGALPIYKDSSERLYTSVPNPDPNSSAMGSIYKSTDNGTTWSADTMNISSTTGRIFFVDELGGEHIASSIVGFSYYGRAYQRDSTGKWIPDTAGIPMGSYAYASSMGTDHGGLIYLSGTYVGAPRVLHRSITGGSWSVDTVGLASSVLSFYLMKPGKPGEVFGTNYHLMYRHSAGVWNQVPLPSSNIFKFTVDRNGTIFIVNTAVVGALLADVGISMSTDDGASWTILTHDTIQVDALHSRGDTSYALLRGGGLYALTKNGLVTGVPISQRPLLPSTYELSPNYPNPFNPTATIQYNLPYRSGVSLKVYDILGQLVATLASGMHEAGNQSVTWNASNFASGIYFYQLEATSIADPSKTFTQVRKMVLLK